MNTKADVSQNHCVAVALSRCPSVSMRLPSDGNTDCRTEVVAFFCKDAPKDGLLLQGNEAWLYPETERSGFRVSAPLIRSGHAG